MNNPNPLIPKGSLMEQQAKGSPHLRVALVIVVVHLIFLGGLLMQGCKPEDEAPGDQVKGPGKESIETDTLDMENLFGGAERGEPEPDPGLGGATLGNPSNQLGGLDRTPVGDSNTLSGELVPEPPTQPEELEVSVSGEEQVEPDRSVAPERQPSVVQHTIVRGDTFSSLSRRYDVPVSAITEANSTLDPSKLAIGQVVHIPVGAPTARQQTPALPAGVTIYEVKKNDTLSRIARAVGTTVQKIKELNQMTTDRILVGQKLKVPSSAAGGN